MMCAQTLPPVWPFHLLGAMDVEPSITAMKCGPMYMESSQSPMVPVLDMMNCSTTVACMKVLTPSRIPAHAHTRRIHHRKRHLICIIALMLLGTCITPGIIRFGGYIGSGLATGSAAYRWWLIPGEDFDGFLSLLNYAFSFCDDLQSQVCCRAKVIVVKELQAGLEDFS